MPNKNNKCFAYCNLFDFQAANIQKTKKITSIFLCNKPLDALNFYIAVIFCPKKII